MNTSFEFEDLPVYKKAVEFVINVNKTTKAFPKGYTYITDQFRRAALSIPLNIAEGYGRWHKKEKVHFYQIAKGSAYECVPILDVCIAETIISNKDHASLRGMLFELVRMITGLAQAVEKRC